MKQGFKRTTAAILAALILAGAGTSVAVLSGVGSTMAHASEDNNNPGDNNPTNDGTEATIQAPTKDGNIWTVTPENAQATMDGQFGSIDDTEIHFSAGNYDKLLILAQPSAYAASGTVYYKGGSIDDNKEAKIAEGSDKLSDEQIATLKGGTKTYVRKISNVTFTAEEGATFAGFQFSAGHAYGTSDNHIKDPVTGEDIPSTNNSYYAHCSLENITFDGLTFNNQTQHQINIVNSLSDCTVSGIKIQNCTFVGNLDGSEGKKFAAIRMQLNPYDADQAFENIEIQNCSFKNCYQGIYIQSPNGLTVKNSVFDTTTHNAIAVQSATYSDSNLPNPAKGNVTIEENIIKNAGDRAIRFGEATGVTDVQIHNNVMINSGDDSGELFKAQSLPTSTSNISLENNYWDGKESTAIANSEITQKGGAKIVAGTFPEDVSAYVATDKASIGITTNTSAEPTYYVGTQEEVQKAIDDAIATTGIQEVTVVKVPENGDNTPSGTNPTFELKNLPEGTKVTVPDNVTGATVTANGTTVNGSLTITPPSTGGGTVVTPPVEPEKPTVAQVQNVIAVKKATNWLKLNFDRVDGADGYEIYNAETNEKLADCTTQNGRAVLTKTITNLEKGTTYKLQVRAYKLVDGERVYGKFSEVYTKATAHLDKVTGVRPIKKTQTTLKIQFNKVEGAERYKIFDAETGKVICNVSTQSGADVLKKTITGLNAGETRKYKVRAYATINGKSEYGEFSNTLVKATAK